MGQNIGISRSKKEQPRNPRAYLQNLILRIRKESLEGGVFVLNRELEESHRPSLEPATQPAYRSYVRTY